MTFQSFSYRFYHLQIATYHFLSWVHPEARELTVHLGLDYVGFPVNIFTSQIIQLDVSPPLDFWPHLGDADAHGASAQSKGGEANDAREHEIEQGLGFRVHRLSHDDGSEEDAEAGASG